MPSFADSIFLFVLALLLFGPKKLPVLARELGKWMGEFRRASNEFKMQMEDELRASEQADRQKQVAAMEAAAPIPPPLDEPAEPEHPHLRAYAEPATEPEPPLRHHTEPAAEQTHPDAPSAPTVSPSAQVGSAPNPSDTTRPLPIAVSGSLKMMPPATGLPTPRSTRPNPLAGLIKDIPVQNAPVQDSPDTPAAPTDSTYTEGVAHGN